MIVEIAANWKTLSIIGGMVLSAAGATYAYIDGVDTRLDDVEAVGEQLVDEVKLNRCMLLEHHEGGEPLLCLEEE